ncbi:MAG: hypothetical protein JXA30_16455 [Deltaproteobacteria bacterium]|nr:hypothetical protein [Deltaproteobacteria bacterium]
MIPSIEVGNSDQQGGKEAQLDAGGQENAGTQTDDENQGNAGTQDTNVGSEGIAGDTRNNGTTQNDARVSTEADAQDIPEIDAGGVGNDSGQVVDSSSNTGPFDYGEPGPYEVTVEKNVGERFRNNVPDDTATCVALMSALLANEPEALEDLTIYPADMDRQLYTLFRPTQLEEGKKYPVITWGDGTCSQPLVFSKLLEHLASHGFLVIASNYRQVASGVEMQRGIDFMLSENENANSYLYGKVDTQMLGACGHSQGSSATIVVGADERIVATVPIQGASTFGVAALKGPTFLIAGELDTTVSPLGIENAFNAATVPAVYGLSIGQDHKMPPVNPSPILKAVTAWFKIHLSNDEEARKLFYGDVCGLCNDPGWVIKRRNL